MKHYQHSRQKKTTLNIEYATSRKIPISNMHICTYTRKWWNNVQYYRSPSDKHVKSNVWNVTLTFSYQVWVCMYVCVCERSLNDPESEANWNGGPEVTLNGDQCRTDIHSAPKITTLRTYQTLRSITELIEYLIRTFHSWKSNRSLWIWFYSTLFKNSGSFVNLFKHSDVEISK